MKVKNTNPAKIALQDKQQLAGAWLQSCSHITSEILAEAGFDVLMIDMEHGPGNITDLVHQIHAMKGEPAVPFVRATWNDFVLIKRILDVGAYGLLVPYINTKEEAQRAVDAIQYPLEGIRGVAGSPRAAHYGYKSNEYMSKANEDIFLMTAVETPTAVENLDEILSIERIDGIFIGPMDLATSMGYFGNPGAPEVQETIKEIEKKVLAKGKSLVSIATSWEDAQKKFERNYSLVFFFSDTTSLSLYARMQIENFNEYKKGKKS